MAFANSSARLKELTKSGTKIGVTAFICLTILPSPNSTPRARCAFMIFEASSISVGTKRNAMESISAISWTGTLNRFNGPNSFSIASVNDNGIDVPREISLIGFDDVLISRYVRPRLTTVRYPIVTMATQAAELALALAEQRPAPEITHLFSPTLVRRHSVVAPQEGDKS